MQDLRLYSVKKDILKNICIQNDIDFKNCYINKKFGYVETIDSGIRSPDLCTGIIYGEKFKIKFFDGCFNPFIVSLGMV